MDVRSEALQKRSRYSRQQWLAASRRRLLAQRRRRTHGDAHRVRANDRAGCQDRQAGADVRHRWPGRSCRGPAAAGRPRLLRHDFAAGDRSRRDRGRLVGHGLVGTPAVAARRRARLRCRHRPAALDLPHRRARRGARRRNLGEGILEGSRQRQCLGADERRRGTGLCLFAGLHADQRLLRRPSPRRRPVWREPGLPRCGDRQEGLALSARPSRAVGLRPAGRAQPDRHHRRRKAASRRSRR